MIKPRSLPSHFELQAKAQQRNFEGETISCSHSSFNQLNGQSMLPVMPMTSVTTPATIDRGQPIWWNTQSYHKGHQSHRWQGSHPQSSDDNTKTFNSIHQRCSSSSLHPIQKVTDVLVTFHVCKLYSASVSFIQYGLVKHEHCGLHSSPLVLF